MKHVLTYYLKGWKWTISNWRLVILLFIFNWIFSVLAFKPMSNLLKSKLSSIDLPTHFSQGFDFTIYSDLFRTNPDILNSYIAFAIWLIPFYLIWIVFSNAGIVYKTLTTNSNFWKGGSEYFFRIFRLTLYYSITISLLLILFALIFNFGTGLNILQLETENLLVSKFYLLSSVTLILMFLLKSIYDYTKILIVKQNENYITKSVIQAFKASFQTKLIPLCLINGVFILTTIGALLLTKFNVESMFLTTIITTIILLFRIMTRIAKIAALGAMAEVAKK